MVHAVNNELWRLLLNFYGEVVYQEEVIKVGIPGREHNLHKHTEAGKGKNVQETTGIVKCS